MTQLRSTFTRLLIFSGLFSFAVALPNALQAASDDIEREFDVGDVEFGLDVVLGLAEATLGVEYLTLQHQDLGEHERRHGATRETGPRIGIAEVFPRGGLTGVDVGDRDAGLRTQGELLRLERLHEQDTNNQPTPSSFMVHGTPPQCELFEVLNDLRAHFLTRASLNATSTRV